MQLIIDGATLRGLLDEAIKRAYPAVEIITDMDFRESGAKDGEYTITEIADIVIECEMLQKLPRRKKTKT